MSKNWESMNRSGSALLADEEDDASSNLEKDFRDFETGNIDLGSKGASWITNEIRATEM